MLSVLEVCGFAEAAYRYEGCGPQLEVGAKLFSI
jgi:hypothetical protein